MLLSFEKPKKLRSTEEHNDMHVSDSGVRGTYVPNMSTTDMLKWKAKQIGGTDPRIEIRKSISPTQILVVVRSSGVTMSANGKIGFDNKLWKELHQVVKEAQHILTKS